MATITGFTGAQSMDWLDINADGVPEVAIGDDGPAQVFRYADGAFSSIWTEPTPGACTSVGWAFVNGDSYPDLGVAHCTGGPARVFLGSATGLAATAGWTAPQNQWTIALSWGDLNGDGAPDLLLPNLSNLGPASRIYLGGDGTLADTHAWEDPLSLRGACAAWADIDGDGDDDLALSAALKLGGTGDGGIHVWRNDAGTPTHIWSDTSQQGLEPRCPAWVDFDGDGELDLFHAVAEGESRIYALKDGEPSDTILWRGPAATHGAWADADGDGRKDLALAFANAPNRILKNTGGTLVPLWDSSESEDSRRVTFVPWSGQPGPNLAVLSRESVRVYACR